MNGLRAVDPVSAKRLHPNDITRVSRALEVYELTGIALSAQEQPEAEAAVRTLYPGYGSWNARRCTARINARVVQMMKDGLLSEVEALLKAGVSPQAQAMQGIGYKELVPVLLGANSRFPTPYRIFSKTRAGMPNGS